MTKIRILARLTPEGNGVVDRFDRWVRKRPLTMVCSLTVLLVVIVIGEVLPH